MTPSFWSGKKVFLTGHTGFKGAWMVLWLQSLGAQVRGYSLPPPTKPSLFELAHADTGIDSIIADVRDGARLLAELKSFRPDIVVHMAAQSLVRLSYEDPAGTYATNVMGTVHLLEAVRQTPGVRVVVNVTSDKCYENREWIWGYRETDPMGGYDPYSNSKGCAELVTGAYRQSFFNPQQHGGHRAALASARSGNVIGGGDWARDRLLPDVVGSLMKNEPARIRHPEAVRPWQHVLEPIRGYLHLAERLWDDRTLASGWNFGPGESDIQPVAKVVEMTCKLWGGAATWEDCRDPNAVHEAGLLKLDISKARHQLGWTPVWDLKKGIEQTVVWYRNYAEKKDMRDISLEQIRQYVCDSGMRV